MCFADDDAAFPPSPLHADAQPGSHLSKHGLLTLLAELPRYLLLHLLPLRWYTRKHRRKIQDKAAPDLIVSLTTIPDRINKISPALSSLLDQTMPARHIYLAVPEYSIRENRAYEIPEALLRCAAV